MKKIIWALLITNLILITVIIILLKSNIESDEIRIEAQFRNSKQFYNFYLGRGDYEVAQYYEGHSILNGVIREETIECENEPELLVDLFCELPKGTPVVKIDNKIIETEKECSLVQYVVSEKSLCLSFLDFDKMEIVFDCQTETAKKILNMKTVLKYDDREYPATIKHVGYHVNGGNLEVTLSSDLMLLPGETVMVKVVTEVLHDVVAVRNIDLLHDNSGAFLYDNADKYKDNQEPLKIYVQEIFKDDDYTIIDINEEYINGMVSSTLN